MISTTLSTQKMRAIDSACRLQNTSIAQLRVRPLKDWEVIKEELTVAIYPKVLEQLCQLATSDPYGFLFINLKDGMHFAASNQDWKLPNCSAAQPQQHLDLRTDTHTY